MGTNTNVDIAVDGSQAMTLLLDGIETLIPSKDPIVVNVRNQTSYTFQIIAHHIAHGKLELEPGGSLTGDIPPDNDLIFGLKSNNAGSKGIVLMASTETYTINSVESYVVASYFFQHTLWGTIGTNGAIIPVPVSMYQILEQHLSTYTDNLMDKYANAKQTRVFQNPSTSFIPYSGEMVNIKSPEGKDELQANFNMGV